MKRMNCLTLLALAGIITPLWGRPALAQTPAPPAHVAVKPLAKKKTITEDEAVKIALKRVPGTLQNMAMTNETQPHQVLIFSKAGKECEVFVDRSTGAVGKVNIPRLTKKQAIAAALKKVKGKAQDDASHYEAATGVHTIVIVQAQGSVASVEVSDKSGKVVRVVRDSGGRG